MARWFLLSVIIVLIAIDPAFGFLKLLGNVVTNVLGSAVGAIKFIEQLAAYPSKEVRDTTPKNRQEYDFIIVGAGSAGSVIASRLSENKDLKILLIEAGGHENLLMDIPLVAIFLPLDTGINWEYLTEPSDDYCRGIQNRQCKTHKGRVLGGTSSINFMIAVRGNKHDYNEWAKLTGDDNWSYKGMLQSFKKMETFHNDFVEYNEDYHGFNGPIRITNIPYRSPLVKAFVKAGEEMGFSSVDYNGPTQTGFNYMQTNQINGERLSSNRAYLHPARKRGNLFVSINSHVNKILIDPITKTAYGVEFTKNRKKIEVIARKEVILSAGAIASPKILMLSGIGPANQLKNFGINVLQDAPVGENMMDHITYGGLFFLVNDTIGFIIEDLLNPSKPIINDYLNKRTGIIASAGGTEGLAYVNVDNLRDKTDSPNIELLFAPISLVSEYLIHVPFGITGKYWTDYFADKLYRRSWLLWPMLLKPRSRGKILLRSADPKDKPRVLANYFTDPEDVRVLTKGIRMAIEVSKTNAMQKYGSELNDRLVPGCEKYEPDSDDYWECAMRTYTITLWHHAGTCKMGKENDPTAVVNTKLQVKGINNLRVVDASIMPDLIRAHINIPTMAIGEKFVDILKSDYGF